MRRLTFLGVLASSALIVLGAAPTAQADLMPSLAPPTTSQISSPPPVQPPSGTFAASYSTISPGFFPSTPMGHATFTLGSGTALFGGSSAGGFTVSDLTIDATPFTGNLPPSATGPVNLSNPFILTDSGNGKTATFNLINAATVNEVGMPNGPVSGTLTNSVQLISNNDPSINLSAYANGGTFRASFSNIDFENTEIISSLSGVSPLQSGFGLAFYPSGPDQPISFTFTLTPNAENPVTPEPGSLVLWALAAAAGLGGLRRRYWRGRAFNRERSRNARG
jgi:hypothetical protein